MASHSEPKTWLILARARDERPRLAALLDELGDEHDGREPSLFCSSVEDQGLSPVQIR